MAMSPNVIADNIWHWKDSSSQEAKAVFCRQLIADIKSGKSFRELEKSMNVGLQEDLAGYQPFRHIGVLRQIYEILEDKLKEKDPV